MPAYAVTWFFEGLQAANVIGRNFACGWTETWYSSPDTANVEAALSSAMFGPNYLDLRLACLSNIYRVPWVRASNVNNPRDSKVAHLLNKVGLIDGAAGTNSEPMQVQCALLVDFFAPPIAASNPPDHAHHRRFLLRGLDGSVASGNVIASIASIAAHKAFFDKMGAHETGTGLPPGFVQALFGRMRVVDQNGRPKVPITAMTTLAPPNNRVIELTAALGALNFGDKIQITGVNSPQGVNRIWTVLETAAAPPYKLGGPRRIFAGTFGGLGRAQKIVYTTVPITQWTLIGLSSRDTGVPFRPLRGRARASE